MEPDPLRPGSNGLALATVTRGHSQLSTSMISSAGSTDLAVVGQLEANTFTRAETLLDGSGRSAP
jgi:hydrogenase maturation factor